MKQNYFPMDNQVAMDLFKEMIQEGNPPLGIPFAFEQPGENDQVYLGDRYSTAGIYSSTTWRDLYQRSSAMDGYACSARDLPDTGTAALQIVGVSWAGRPYPGEVRQGQCVRIMTGAVLPEATDTVVMQEHVRLDGTSIVIVAGYRAGQNVRAVGEDMRRGALAVAAGTLLQPSQLGLLASLGVARVPVRRRPRVAICSTGDKLRSPGEPLAPGQIYDSNGRALHGVLTRLGVEVVDLGSTNDPGYVDRKRTHVG